MKEEKNINYYKLVNKTTEIFKIDCMYLTEKGRITLDTYIKLVLYDTPYNHTYNLTGLMVADAFLKTVKHEMVDIFNYEI